MENLSVTCPETIIMHFRDEIIHNKFLHTLILLHMKNPVFGGVFTSSDMICKNMPLLVAKLR